jgi:hypothetical protein
VAWIFVQRTGELLRDGVVHGCGYSGHAEGKNNPAMQAERCVGPIPVGVWEVRGPPTDSRTHGPFILRLVPHDGTDTFGRTGFMLHGDSIAAPGTASLGCIVMPRKVRERVWASGDRALLVVADEPAMQGVA